MHQWIHAPEAIFSGPPAEQPTALVLPDCQQVVKTVKEALELDKKNGNTLWADAIAEEMKDVRVPFKILPDGQSASIGYQKIPCHVIFNMKMEDFRCKA